MGRAPCCSKVGLQRGPWTPKEDTLLTKYIHAHGEGCWRSLPKKAGLLRCGKSCRLRWLNYLRPDIKRGNISSDEDDLIIRLHILLGNRWSVIAGRLPGRTDNEIKNYWNTHLSKKLRLQGIDPETHKSLLPIRLELDHAETDSKKNKVKKRRTTLAMIDDNNNNPREKHQTINKSVVRDGDKEHDLKKHVVHVYLPKPVRVSCSLSLLSRNDSFMSTITSDHQPAAASGDHIINFQNDDNKHSYGTQARARAEFFIGKDHNTNDQAFSGSDDLHLGFEEEEDDDHYQLCTQDDFFGDKDNFNKMYDEYLQVLKTSSAADDVDNSADENQLLLQLVSFDESFLV